MSFFSDYSIYTANHESPEIYHRWSAFAAMSSIVSKRVSIPLGHFTVYPNLYVVLVGGPGNRKSSAMGVAKRLIRATKVINMSADSTTAEAFANYMSKHCTKTFAVPGDATPFVYTPLTCFVTELSQFVGTASGPMINLLTTIWDEHQYEYKTVGRGTDFIEEPYVVILGCATPAWITARLKDDIISGGFSRRAAFIYAEESDKKVPRPKTTPEELAAFERMVDFAKRMQDCYGEMVWTPDAERYHDNWYMSRELPNDPSVRGWHRSKQEQLLKLGTLFALADESDLKLDSVHLQAAMQALDQMEERLSLVFAGFGRNELNSVAHQLQIMVENAGGALLEREARSKMFTYCNAMEYDAVRKHLVDSDVLVMRPNKTQTDMVLLTQKRFKELEAAIARAKVAAESRTHTPTPPGP
jgi:hypothetical protein